VPEQVVLSSWKEGREKKLWPTREYGSALWCDIEIARWVVMSLTELQSQGGIIIYCSPCSKQRMRTLPRVSTTYEEFCAFLVTPCAADSNSRFLSLCNPKTEHRPIMAISIRSWRACRFYTSQSQSDPINESSPIGCATSLDAFRREEGDKHAQGQRQGIFPH
jgi:hypothetical protein